MSESNIPESYTTSAAMTWSNRPSKFDGTYPSQFKRFADTNLVVNTLWRTPFQICSTLLGSPSVKTTSLAVHEYTKYVSTDNCQLNYQVALISVIN